MCNSINEQLVKNYSNGFLDIAYYEDDVYR